MGSLQSGSQGLRACLELSSLLGSSVSLQGQRGERGCPELTPPSQEGRGGARWAACAAYFLLTPPQAPPEPQYALRVHPFPLAPTEAHS